MKLPPRTSGGSQATPSLSRSVDNSKIYNCQDLQDKNAPVGTKCKTTIGKLFMRVDRPNLLEAWKMCDTDDCKKGYVISGVIERGRGYFDSVRICGRLGAVIPDPDKFLEAIDYRIYEVLPNLTENSWFHILYVDSYFDFFRRYVGRAKSIEKSYADQTFGTGDVRCALSE
jgi:hypothetical protein